MSATTENATDRKGKVKHVLLDYARLSLVMERLEKDCDSCDHCGNCELARILRNAIVTRIW